MEVDKNAKLIWNFHHVNHKLKKADCILVLGSNDLRVAEYGVKLFLKGWAPFIIFSGTGLAHQNDLLKTNWKRSEAQIFAQIARKMGVPEKKIIIEKNSKNTGENIQFTKKLLNEKNINPKNIIVVQKPYMERRTFATFKKVWPEKYCIITSPPISFEDYPNNEISKEKVINLMVGDLQRIKIYPEKGFQIHQEIPNKVWRAYKILVKLGYTKHLLK